eukprot:CAMPEP_0115382290 /NCGR_PEP_ID=MMETSP0271-20121206/6007_1 /TAXON_ID=71861 /ORGANISM="Scrippsiella trochoidea, Strain CCMP3099" /LENGTH=103 /DNA_ID=CAMNT_0002805591 /DNA_START=50 /DNA_END=362 /DNA_ORIENTATION=+
MHVAESRDLRGALPQSSCESHDGVCQFSLLTLTAFMASDCSPWHVRNAITSAAHLLVEALAGTLAETLLEQIKALLNRAMFGPQIENRPSRVAASDHVPQLLN